MRYSIIFMLWTSAAMSDSASYHSNTAAKAIQQHLVRVKPAIQDLLDDIDTNFSPDTFPAVASLDTLSPLQNSSLYPINVTYTYDNNPTPSTATVTITFASDFTGTTQPIPQALEDKTVVLTANTGTSPYNSIISWSCETTIDTGANLWDGYKAASSGNLSRIVAFLGDFYTHCTVT